MLFSKVSQEEYLPIEKEKLKVIVKSLTDQIASIKQYQEFTEDSVKELETQIKELQKLAE